MNNLPFNEVWPVADAARLGLMTTLQGMGIVFLVLALLALVTMISSKIIRAMLKEPAKEPAKKEAEAPVVATDPVEKEKHTMVVDGVENEETVAVIMAIVAFNTGTPVENLKFNSIKAID